MSMQIIFNIATILGGLTALWFLYDRRVIIFNWFKIWSSKSVNSLSLPDDEFEFIFDRAKLFIEDNYSPLNTKERELCLSLKNHGVLKDRNGGFKLTGPGKRMLAGTKA